MFLSKDWDSNRLLVISFDVQKIAEEIHEAAELYRKALPRIEEIEKEKVEEIKGHHAKIKETKELIEKATRELAKEIAGAMQNK